MYTLNIRSDADFSVYTTNGRELYSRKLQPGKFTFRKRLPSGEYVFCVQFKNYATFEKIQVAR